MPADIRRKNLDIELYGDPITEKDKIQIINEKGELYIKAGKNVTVLDNTSERRLGVFAERKQTKGKRGGRGRRFPLQRATRNITADCSLSRAYSVYSVRMGKKRYIQPRISLSRYSLL